jgi:MFS family permease
VSNQDPERVTPYAWYVAVVFSLFSALSFLDRQILAVLIEPMKAELDLTDVQITLIGGLSFVIFYVIFGLAMGRLADTLNRKWIIYAGVVLWTSATALCGLATRYGHLLVLRMGVGLGEAALAPCAFSILADTFPRKRLATGIAVTSMGASFGIGLAYLGGALVLDWANGLTGDDGSIDVPLVGDLTPWRVVLLAIGLPGLLMSVLLFTIREPPRRDPGSAGVPTAKDVLSYVWSHRRTILLHNVGIGFLSLASYAGGFWDIAFFERTYGWPPEQSGLLYGLLAMFAAAIGNLLTGIFADHSTNRWGWDTKIMMLLIVALASVVFRIIYPLMPTAGWALVMVVPSLFLASAPYGVGAAAVQIMVPPRMRGQVTALYYLVQTLIGLSLGPTLVAIFTEHVFEALEMLRYSLVIVGTTASLAAALLFFLALAPYQSTLAELKTRDVH